MGSPACLQARDFDDHALAADQSLRRRRLILEHDSHARAAPAPGWSCIPTSRPKRDRRGAGPRAGGGGGAGRGAARAGGRGGGDRAPAAPASRALFGSGKIEELGQGEDRGRGDRACPDRRAVTPVQQRNLKRPGRSSCWTAPGLILEIFSDRARTREGVLQVEMAALLPAHAAGAGLDPPGTPARRPGLRGRPGRDPDRGRPPRHRRGSSSGCAGSWTRW
jgi:hypothetical protein